MNNKVVYGITAVTVLLIAGIFLSNLVSLFSVYRQNTYFNPNQIRGMAVYHNNIPYTLNFAQQNSVINYLNEAIQIDDSYNSNINDLDKIIIYRFDQSELVLEPIGVIQDNNLVFSASPWNRSGFMATPRELKELITKTYDK